jgi:peptidyl-tRNA hydrolase, PTH1 family
MKLIVGLGNPGRQYEQTRHNVGFMVASKVAGLIGAGPTKAKFSGEIAEGMAGKSPGSVQSVVILCPHTYMNGSGKSVRSACDFYKLSLENLLIVCDDLNLATGRIRMRATGSAGGQKGLADIIRQLGTEAFPRLRIGIDRPNQQWNVSDYVLGKFSEEEKVKIDDAIDAAAQAVMDWITDGIDIAMCRHNISDKPTTNKITTTEATPNKAKPHEAKPSVPQDKPTD